MTSDKDLIEQHGGAAKVAAILDFSVQRVQNWKARGIPPRVRLDHPELFPAEKPPTTRRRTQVTPP